MCAESSATFVPLYGKCISNLLNPSACSLAGGSYNTLKSWCEFPPVTTITCPLLELENGGIVETAYNPLTGRCEGSAPSQVNFKAGECNGVLSQVSIGVYTCTVPPTISYEKPSCAGKLEEVQKGIYVCKLTATQIQNITIQEPIVVQPFVFERIPDWVLYAVASAIVIFIVYLVKFRKK